MRKEKFSLEKHKQVRLKEDIQMGYQQEHYWLGEKMLKAEAGGNECFYEMLGQKIETRKAQWALSDEGGDFDAYELTKLITTAHRVLQYIRIQVALRE